MGNSPAITTDASPIVAGDCVEYKGSLPEYHGRCIVAAVVDENQINRSDDTRQGFRLVLVSIGQDLGPICARVTSVERVATHEETRVWCMPAHVWDAYDKWAPYDVSH